MGDNSLNLVPAPAAGAAGAANVAAASAAVAITTAGTATPKPAGTSPLDALAIAYCAAAPGIATAGATAAQSYGTAAVAQGQAGVDSVVQSDTINGTGAEKATKELPPPRGVPTPEAAVPLLRG